MITKWVWEEFLYVTKLIENSFVKCITSYTIMKCLLLSIIAIPVDIILLPVEILALLITKILMILDK